MMKKLLLASYLQTVRFCGCRHDVVRDRALLKMRLLTLGLLVLVSFAGSASAQLYLATGSVGDSTPHGELYTISSTGSVLSDIGALNDSSGTNYPLTGLALVNGTMYGITAGTGSAPNTLVIVNPTTAAVQIVGALGTRATDIASSGGVLYCVSGNSKFFFQINLTTGAAIQLGDTGLPPQDGGALGADANGNIFGATLSDQTTGAITFYRYDLTNGAATAVGDTGSILFPRALTFDGDLVGLEGGTLRTPSAARFIGIYDPLTGSWTQTGSTVPFADALVWVPIPEPSAWLLLVIGGAVLSATKSTKGRRICPRSCGLSCAR